MKRINCTIKGQSPLLMHSFPMQPIEAIEKKTPEEQAEYSAYRDPESNNLYIPGMAIQRSLVGAATYSKGKGRGSLQKPVAACVSIFPERCDLGVSSYNIDSRAVVMPATKGRVIRFRPRLDEWAWMCTLSIVFSARLTSRRDTKKGRRKRGSSDRFRTCLMIVTCNQTTILL